MGPFFYSCDTSLFFFFSDRPSSFHNSSNTKFRCLKMLPLNSDFPRKKMIFRGKTTHHLVAKKTSYRKPTSISLNQKWSVLLMEEILHKLISTLSHYLQGFIHPRWLAGFLNHQQYQTCYLFFLLTRRRHNPRHVSRTRKNHFKPQTSWLRWPSSNIFKKTKVVTRVF